MRSAINSRKKQVVIVGAGIAGLTAGAYILRGGHQLLILEKTPQCGGHVSSFRKDGFLFDTGPRAFGNAGILEPMLKELGIDLPLIKGEVSTGIEDRIVHYESNADIDEFTASLQKLFPSSRKEIHRIEKEIRTSVKITKTLNKVDNPFFKNILRDRRYLFRELLPWLPSFLWAVTRTALNTKSVEEVLQSISSDQALNDMVSQHFFKGTPANFAFGYFQNFQDYKYPPGGTGRLPEALAGNIAARGGLIKNDCEVVGINPDQKILTDQNGSVYPYDALLWAADLKTLYRCFDYEKSPPKLRKVIEKQKNKYLPVKAGESVFTVFLAVDRPAEKFKEKSKGHFIYTPSREGLGELHRTQLKRIKANFKGVTKDELFRWLKEFCLYNSYEISIPALKNASLAPPGKTGLIISLLFDGELWKLAARAGWYDEFRTQTVEYILEALENSIYPGLKDIILFQKSATPLTLMELFGSDNGAITGWSLEEKPPVPRSLTGIMGSAKTTIPYVFRCGQWSYSPSGVPIAILTGRIAAREVLKKSARYKDRL